MRQDERIRALERELLRSGSSLYSWAAAVVDVPPFIQFFVPPKTTVTYDFPWSADASGSRITLENAGLIAVTIDVNINLRGGNNPAPLDPWTGFPCARDAHDDCPGAVGNRSDREFCECTCHARGPCPDGCDGDPRNSDCRHTAEDM